MPTPGAKSSQRVVLIHVKSPHAAAQASNQPNSGAIYRLRKARKAGNMKAHLIREVKKWTCLWDKRIIDYKNREMVRAAWMEVSQALGIDVETCKKAWKNLQDQFRRHILQILKDRDKRNIEDVEQAFSQVKWIHFQSMSFLKDIMLKKSDGGPQSIESDSGSDTELSNQVTFQSLNESSGQELSTYQIIPENQEDEESIHYVTEPKDDDDDDDVPAADDSSAVVMSGRVPMSRNQVFHIGDGSLMATSTPASSFRSQYVSPVVTKKKKHSDQGTGGGNSEDVLMKLVQEVHNSNMELSKTKNSREERFADYVIELMKKVPDHCKTRCELEIMQLIQRYEESA